MDKLKEIIEEYKFQIIIGLSLLVLAMAGYTLMNGKSATASPDGNLPSQMKTPRKDDTASSASSEDDSNKPLFVDVKGAVNKPGVYQAGKNMRVTDVVELAGGFNPSADIKHLNLAQKISDQEVVYVPIKGEVKGLPTGLKHSSSSTAGSHDDSSGEDSDSSKININHADKSKLQQLTGIGDKKADKIINYRKTNGPFRSPDDLKKVNGFGDKTVATLKSSISV